MADKYTYRIQTAGDIQAECFEREAEGLATSVKNLYLDMAARLRRSDLRLVRVWEKVR
jgi:hypothetical protein